ncbi:hypothetical protein M1589_00665 [Candidatus Marsarchaeota archaeon]|nr:hypothetical protein [Candidatus Marsarchaeota archaeon]MCL5115391.1 hypothetical protein [Candidatus Marsarchaeota archaeon]
MGIVIRGRAPHEARPVPGIEMFRPQQEPTLRNVVPGVREYWHTFNDTYGGVGLRVKATEEQYKKVKGSIDASMVSAEPKELAEKINVTYDQRGYIDFSLGGYHVSQDSTAVRLLTSLTDSTYKSIHGGDLSGAPRVGLAEAYRRFSSAGVEVKRETYSDKSVIPVMQGYFGELTGDTISLGFNKMETWGIGTSVALVLVGGEDNAVLLAHIDVLRKLASLEMNPRYKSVEKAFVILSSQSSSDIKYATLYFAKRHACTVEVINQSNPSAIIGVDANGIVYEPRKLIKGVIPEDPLERTAFELSLCADALSPKPPLRSMTPLLRRLQASNPEHS